MLFLVKHNIDRFVAVYYFNRPWSLFSYWMPSDVFSLPKLPPDQVPFYFTLLVIALIFIWVGATLTLRRLRDAGLPLWLVGIFFVPVVNLFFFLLLSLLPSKTALQNNTASQSGSRIKNLFAHFVPEGQVGSAFAGIIITLPLALLATQFSIVALENYGWGVFVGLPFFIGLASVLIYGYQRPRTFGACLAVALLSIVLFGAVLIGLAVEGLICIVMAAPIGAVLAAFGGAIGYVIQRRDTAHAPPATNTFTVYFSLFLLVPFLMTMESLDAPQTRIVPVRTSVIVDASPEQVWRHVISFSELPEPEGMFFKLGFAYPVRAEIEGRGVGAVRRCVFSTGAFVEPIEVWDEARLLKFSVTAQPPAMREWSPYGAIETPHLDDYLLSRGGQFQLTSLSGNRTRLEGTTWYEVRIFPQRYWQTWSDVIIHRIHTRVLEHVKQLAETDAQTQASSLKDVSTNADSINGVTWRASASGAL
ncbi:MAG: hypothetical protein MSG64_02685 [Pyrinomonadaceae bacterium MAG19_C2-C3]|nr:hypothetical protein [Pyrinomonadaceae bacterium MAG19_C2-C3]